MQKTLIIAEAGVNHNGSIELAKQLVAVAADAGVDYVKFQTFKAENLVSRGAKQAAYQKRNIGSNADSQYEMLKRLELTYDQHFELIDYCKRKGVKFLSTAFDLESLSFLASLKLGLWKVPSGEITNFPYLRQVALDGQPVILSTGMSTLGDIQQAIAVLEKYGLQRTAITVLHCNTQYPTPMDDVNLLAMQRIASEFGVKVGYSDHTEGIEVAIAAVALGARVIEKHFTLDKNMEGPDHRASLEPAELNAMVCSVRNVERALGSKEKVVTKSEEENIKAARKSIVAACAISQGELLTEQNITVKRPAGGISPMRWEEIVGTRASRSFAPDDLIEL